MSTVADSYSANLAAALRAELARQRLSVSALAIALGVSRETASDRVNGNSALNADEIEGAAAFLGISVDDLNESADFGSRLAGAVAS